MPLSLVLKTSSKTVNIQDVETSWTIVELKKHIEKETDVAAERQRIIYKGRVLKDDQTVEGAGIQDGHAVHMVAGAKRAEETASTPSASAATTSPPASTTAATPATNTTPTDNNNNAANPFAAMFGGGMGSGMGGMGGGMGGMGGMGPGGMPAGMDMQQTMQLMQNPMIQQMMTHMMQQPGFMESMTQQHPMLQNLPPEVRAQMSNPQFMQQMMSMMGAMGGAPGATGATGAAPGATPQGAATGQAGASPFLNPFLMNALASGGAGGAGGALQGAGAADNRPPRERYAEQLTQMREMGFPNEEANIAVLQQCGGNVTFAIDRLLQG